ncbi:UNVERIFIED_CONTAM: hypothetical protein GTU68_031559, partial [Idotea baltica]|nr:hypothetical protein [Idotea baltica]
QEIPNADTHRQPDKSGYLQKLNSRSFPYLNQWKRRYCVLTKGCLYRYERDTSKGADKGSNVVDLKYFDQVTEAVQKETKKASNVFVVTSQDRSFFDPVRDSSRPWLQYLYVCVYVCMYVYMYVCVYVCMYVCMYSANFGQASEKWPKLRHIPNIYILIYI